MPSGRQDWENNGVWQPTSNRMPNNNSLVFMMPSAFGFTINDLRFSILMKDKGTMPGRGK
jgi:hypothetical protein